MKIIKKSFEDVCVSDITVVSGVRPAGRTIDNSSGRYTNGILYIWSGEVRFWNKDKKSFGIKEGNLVFIPKSYKYKMQYAQPDTVFVLVNFEMFTKNGDNILLSDDITVLAKDDESLKIAGFMNNFELCSAAQSFAATLRRKALLYSLLGLAYEKQMLFSYKDRKSSQIFPGAILLEQNYLENIPVSKFAEASKLSVSSFRALFNKEYGMSPLQYRNRLRVDRAVILLSEGDCTVSEAAYACGFENIGYFCRYYKKITGETPSQTKARRRGNK